MVYSRNLKVVAISALALSMFGCGKKKSKSSSDDGSSDLTISGSLSLSGTDSSGALALSKGFEGNLGLTSFNVSADDLSIYCVTFTLPPAAGTGEVSADGAFSLNISNGKDASVGCFILNGTTQLGTIVFEDPSEKDLSGGASASDKTAFSGNANLGAISLDLETGKAVVDLSKVEVSKKVDASAAASFDFTGTYKITAGGLTQPTGYTAPCTRVEGQEGDSCRGPGEGESVYFRRIAGKSTEDGKDVYGVMAWESEARFNACGKRLGISYADAKTNAKVDLSGSGVAEGAFTWTDGFVDGWKKTDATAKYARPVVKPITVNGVDGLAEGIYTNSGATYVGFQFRPANDNEGGCKDVNGKPVQLTETEWKTLSYNNDRAEIVAGSKIYKSSSSKPDGSVKCTFIGGRFTKGSSATDILNEVNGTFTELTWAEGQDRKKPTANQSCAALAATDALEGARCYADNLWDAAEGSDSACIRRVNFNWGAKTVEQFLGPTNGPIKAFGEHIFEKFRYDSATSGSFRMEEEQFQGLDTGNGWTDCRFIEKMTFALKAIPGSKDLFVEMFREKRNADPKPACIAANKDKNGVMKSQFKMVYQP